MALTPMMQQYVETKKQYADCILFYRLGDFYEMFFEDALTASKELEITLTGKDCGLEERAPMCGVPYHACETYLNRLVEKGYKVAIGEQVEDPKVAKGLVKREVVRIVTPGTNLSAQILDAKKNNYLMSVWKDKQNYGIALCDITTGDFLSTQVTDASKVIDEIHKFEPAEILFSEEPSSMDVVFDMGYLGKDYLKDKLGISVSVLSDWYFAYETANTSIMDQFHVGNLEGLGLKDMPDAVCAIGALLAYLKETQKSILTHLNQLKTYQVEDFMILDSSTRRNLELCETMRDKTKRGSLLWVLDKTKTSMGARMLRQYLEQPLLQKAVILERQEAIAAFNEYAIVREELREYLTPIYDLERLMGKITLKTVNPRDLISFKTSIAFLPHIKTVLSAFHNGLLYKLSEDLDELEDIYSIIDNAISDDPPVGVKEGGMIKDGYNDTIDELKSAKTQGKQWLAELEQRERESSGIKNLKIKYNKVFGYYFDVTNSYQNLVPEHFIRKQTLANSERYTSEELNHLADKILGAEDKLFALEYESFINLRNQLANEALRVQKTAKVIACLDVLASLAMVAEKNNYIRPSINENGVIDIQNGRHPVVEKMIDHDMFIGNDTYLDNVAHRICIITGPNMAGKSTYMRQTALIVLMAQIGSFVPAKNADIGIVDRIFTRVGASDDLASGQSTFMVEMSEVANILRNATANSLLILDEIGRGTSTFDGLSIAWAVVEYISNQELLGAKTLFATHYHELTELEGKLSSVNNYCISVKEQGDHIIFLRKIIKGGADKSYGIQVARLAGVPEIVLNRAREIAGQLADNDIVNIKNIEIFAKPTKQESKKKDNQLSMFGSFNESQIINEIKTMDLSNLTPVKALLYLSELQNRLH